MALSSVLSFWAVAAVLIAIPGPDWAFAISAGLRREVAPAAAGITLGYLATTLVVATGLGLMIGSTPAALTMLTLAGGGYLVWLGIGVLRRPAQYAGAESQWLGPSRWTTVLHGMAVAGLNPKGLLIFVALLPQFSDADAALPLPVQLAILGLTFSATCAVVYLGVGAAARSLLRARPGVARVVSRVSGGAMTVLGAALLLEHLAALA